MCCRAVAPRPSDESGLSSIVLLSIRERGRSPPRFESRGGDSIDACRFLDDFDIGGFTVGGDCGGLEKSLELFLASVAIVNMNLSPIENTGSDGLELCWKMWWRGHEANGNLKTAKISHPRVTWDSYVSGVASYILITYQGSAVSNFYAWNLYG
jgi:hypothetical protein